MSDDKETGGLSAEPLRWYSVAIRYFVPSIGAHAFVYPLTLPAFSDNEVIEAAARLFIAQTYREETDSYHLPDGTMIKVWHVHALEIPDPYAEELHRGFREWRNTITTLRTPSAESDEWGDNVLPFPPHPKPDDPEPSNTE